MFPIFFTNKSNFPKIVEKKSGIHLQIMANQVKINFLQRFFECVEKEIQISSKCRFCDLQKHEKRGIIQ
jgi:hypothetical protein